MATCRVTSARSVHSACPRGRWVFYSTGGCGKQNTLQITARECHNDIPSPSLGM